MFKRRHCAGTLIATVLLVSAARTQAVEVPAANDPSFYIKAATWEETLRVSREKLSARETAAEQKETARRETDPGLSRFEPLQLEMQGRATPRKLRISVVGMEELYLGVRQVVRQYPLRQLVVYCRVYAAASPWLRRGEFFVGAHRLSPAGFFGFIPRNFRSAAVRPFNRRARSSNGSVVAVPRPRARTRRT